MVRVLLVDDDPVFRSVIQRMLRGQESLQLIEATGLQEATAILRQDAPHLLLADLRLGDGDGLDLIQALPEIAPDTLPILMSGAASSRDYQSALRLGVVDVLSKPFTREELLAVMQRAIDSLTGFRGSVHGLSLPDLLQLFHLSRRSLVLGVRGPRRQGSVVFSEGEIIHAEVGDFQGECALQVLLAMSSGAIHTSPFRDAPRSIRGDFQGVLMDAFREIDEQGRDTPLPSPLLSSVPAPALSPDSDSEPLALRVFVEQLDSELCAALLHDGKLRVAVGGRLSTPRWEAFSALAFRLMSQDAASWRQLLWVIGDTGLALLRDPARGRMVLLVQHFVGRLDDRRFRWNVVKVERFLAEG